MGLCVSLMDDNWGLSSSSSKSLEQGLEHTKVVKFLKTLLNLTVLAILVTAIGKYCFKVNLSYYLNLTKGTKKKNALNINSSSSKRAALWDMWYKRADVW